MPRSSCACALRGGRCGSGRSRSAAERQRWRSARRLTPADPECSRTFPQQVFGVGDQLRNLIGLRGAVIAADPGLAVDQDKTRRMIESAVNIAQFEDVAIQVLEGSHRPREKKPYARAGGVTARVDRKRLRRVAGGIDG